VRYLEEHAEAGFARCYVGVRLFPIQALESAWVLCVVLVGTLLIVSGEPAGTALAWYIVAYDVARFCFEFLRGDAERPYLWGFSQPQWLSLLLMYAVVWGEFSGVLTLQPWHVVVTLGLTVAVIAIALKRRFRRSDKHQLLHPNHVRELASAIDSVSRSTAPTTPDAGWTVFPRTDNEAILVSRTSLGIQISAGELGSAASDKYHYAISLRDGGMKEEQAQIIAWLILRLKHVEREGELLQGGRGVFHLLIHPLGGAERQML
jgi:hypothetical protein